MPEPRVTEQLEQEWQGLLASLPPARTPSPHELLAVARTGRIGPAALFAELEDVHTAWRALRVSSQLEKYSARFLTTTWTLKDLLAHLASVATECRRQVETAARGERFDYAIPYALSVVGPNQWNQVEVERRRPQPLEAVLEEFEAETRRLEDLLLELPEKSLFAETLFPMAPSGDPTALWKSTIAQMVMMMCSHHRMHTGRIQQWLATATLAEGR